MKNNIYQLLVLFTILTIGFSISCDPNALPDANCIDCDSDLNCTRCATTFFLYDGDTCKNCNSAVSNCQLCDSNNGTLRMNCTKCFQGY